MKTKDQDLKWKLCDAYFSILNNTNFNSINLEDLCLASKVSYDEAKKIVPQNGINGHFFFLQMLIMKLDNETLEELKKDIADDTISSTYDKILEGLTLRFEKYLIYKSAFKIISERLESRVENFFLLLQQNHTFMFKLLDIVEDKQNFILQTVKSSALNSLFLKGVDIFLKDEHNNLDSTVRYLDKYLADIKDIGVFLGAIKR